MRLSTRGRRASVSAAIAVFATTIAFAGSASAAVTPTIPIFKPPVNWDAKILKFNQNRSARFDLTTFNKWLPSEIRTAKLPIAAAIDSLTSVDLRGNAEPVGNQMNINSCASWAIGYGLAGWWANKLGKIPSADWYNPMSVYGAVSNYMNQGTWPADNFNRIKNTGITLESAYSVDDWTYTHHSSSAELTAGASYKFSGWTNLYNTGNAAPGNNAVTALKGVLWNQRVPVAISARVYTGFGGTGTYVKAAGATFRGNHEMLAVGYTTSGLLVQNSWGTGWGNNGYITLGWDYVKSDVYAADYATGMQ